MCGHFGAMGPGISHKDLGILQDLGITSQLRGRDGAGIYQVKSIKYSKHALEWEDFYKTGWSFSSLLDEVEDKRYKEILNSVQPDVIIGHVRAATQGFVNEYNAHPFKFPSLVCAHNGTLKDDKYTKHPSKTDSELMFSDITQRGMEVVFNELDRDSAFACVMYNKVDSKVYFVRNELRTLSFAFLEDRGVMYWASEIDMLRYVLDRKSEKYKVCNLKPNVIVKVAAKDVTVTNISKDYLDIFERHVKLERLLPTSWQKAKDEYEKKKAREAEAEAKAKSKQQEQPKTHTLAERVNNVLAFPKVEGPQEDKELVNPTKKTKFKASTLHKTCSCGSVTLNLFEVNRSILGKNPKVRYNHVDQKHYCNKCEEVKEKAIG